MKSVINGVVGMLVFAVSHLVIYFVRNILRGAAFGVALIALLCLGISGELPAFEWVIGLWMVYAAIGYAALVAVVGVCYTAYEISALIKLIDAGKDSWALRHSLSKSVYNIPGWSFRDNMSK